MTTGQSVRPESLDEEHGRTSEKQQDAAGHDSQAERSESGRAETLLPPLPGQPPDHRRGRSGDPDPGGRMLVLVSQVHQGRCDLDGDGRDVAAQPQACM
jgi:hypothetical protein